MITLTEEKIERIVALTEEGLSRPAIARKTRLNQYRVWQVQAAHDLTHNRDDVRHHQRELVRVRPARHAHAAA